jgi:hypothetical protein
MRDMSMLEEEKWLDHEEEWMFWSSWGKEENVKMVEEAEFEVLVSKFRQAVDDTRSLRVLARKGRVEV